MGNLHRPQESIQSSGQHSAEIDPAKLREAWLGQLTQNDLKSVLQKEAQYYLNAAAKSGLGDFALTDGTNVHVDRDSSGKIAHLKAVERDGGQSPDVLENATHEFRFDPRNGKVISGDTFDRAANGLSMYGDFATVSLHVGEAVIEHIFKFVGGQPSLDGPTVRYEVDKQNHYSF